MPPVPRSAHAGVARRREAVELEGFTAKEVNLSKLEECHRVGAVSVNGRGRWIDVIDVMM